MNPIFKMEEGFIFEIYSNEEERMHIHVVKAENEAKFWLEPELDVNLEIESLKHPEHYPLVIKRSSLDVV